MSSTDVTLVKVGAPFASGQGTFACPSSLNFKGPSIGRAAARAYPVCEVCADRCQFKGPRPWGRAEGGKSYRFFYIMIPLSKLSAPPPLPLRLAPRCRRTVRRAGGSGSRPQGRGTASSPCRPAAQPQGPSFPISPSFWRRFPPPRGNVSISLGVVAAPGTFGAGGPPHTPQFSTRGPTSRVYGMGRRTSHRVARDPRQTGANSADRPSIDGLWCALCHLW